MMTSRDAEERNEAGFEGLWAGIEGRLRSQLRIAFEAGRAEAAAKVRQLAREQMRARWAGTRFEKRDREGNVIASCTMRGPRDFRFRGRKYTSISAAAVAAAEWLGMKARHLDGWHFWGVERRERGKKSARSRRH